MTEPQRRPLGAADMTASELLAVAKDPDAYDKLIKEIVAVREGAHDRQRLAEAAEKQLEETQAALKVATEALDRDAAKMRKEFDAREAALVQREAEFAEFDEQRAQFRQHVDGLSAAYREHQKERAEYRAELREITQILAGP